ncbi:hypothetical protein GCM10008967_20000 [Bacillus carboniphilus]|uniref:Uncharacterized protein n=1 Tax=Bacillus carboniphilus TaxID=86663 RepID=A0ABP3FZB4_9BACI
MANETAVGTSVPNQSKKYSKQDSNGLICPKSMQEVYQTGQQRAHLSQSKAKCVANGTAARLSVPNQSKKYSKQDSNALV